MTTREELIGGYPPLGMVHKNGDRLYGYASGYAAALTEAGTPAVSGLVVKHNAPEIENVRINDRLAIVLCGEWWEVHRNGVPVGRLSFSTKTRGAPIKHFAGEQWDHDSGVLIVERLKISAEDRIVNIGGTAYPLGHPALD